MSVDRYLGSTDARNTPALLKVRQRMHEYYQREEYHREWIMGVNSAWKPGTHDAQLQLCRRIPPNSRVLEVGCGDGAGCTAIRRFLENVSYVGVDLNPRLWPRGQSRFLAARAEELPFRSKTFDVVISMFVIEHLVFPAAFLNEACRVLVPGGHLLLVAPDFETNAMASERIGLGYGSGRDKLRRGRLADASLTLYDSRLRLPIKRLLRRRGVRRGRLNFPILVEPRCLRVPGFTPDCDAIYPASPDEIGRYLQHSSAVSAFELFYKDRSTFGLSATIRSDAR